MSYLNVEEAIKERLAYPFGDLEFEKEYLALQTENEPEALALVFPRLILNKRKET